MDCEKDRIIDKETEEKLAKEERRKARDRRNRVRLSFLNDFDTKFRMMDMDGLHITVSDTEEDVIEPTRAEGKDSIYDELTNIKEEKVEGRFEYSTSDEDRDVEVSDDDLNVNSIDSGVNDLQRKHDSTIPVPVNSIDSGVNDLQRKHDSTIPVPTSLPDEVAKQIREIFGSDSEDEQGNNLGNSNDTANGVEKQLEDMFGPILAEEANNVPSTSERITSNSANNAMKQGSSELNQSQKIVFVKKKGGTKRIFKTKSEPIVDITSDKPIEKSILRLEETVEVEEDDDEQGAVHEIISTMHIAKYETMAKSTTTLKVENIKDEYEEGEISSSDGISKGTSMTTNKHISLLEGDNDIEDYAHNLLESGLRVDAGTMMVQTGFQLGFNKGISEIKSLLKELTYKKKKHKKKRKRSRGRERRQSIHFKHIDKTMPSSVLIQPEAICISDEEAETSTNTDVKDSKSDQVFDCYCGRVKTNIPSLSYLDTNDKPLLPNHSSSTLSCSCWSREKTHRHQSHEKECRKSHKRRYSSSSSSSSSSRSRSSSRKKRHSHYDSTRLGSRSRSKSFSPKRKRRRPSPKLDIVAYNSRSRGRRSPSHSSLSTSCSKSSFQGNSHYSPKRSSSSRSRSRSCSPRHSESQKIQQKYFSSSSPRARSRSRSSSQEYNRRRRSPRHNKPSILRQISVSRQIFDRQGNIHQEKTVTQNQVVINNNVIKQQVTTTTNSFHNKLQSFKNAVDETKKLIEQYGGSDPVCRLDIKVHTVKGEDVTRYRPNGHINHPFHILPEDRELYNIRLKNGSLYVQAFHELCSKNAWDFPLYFVDCLDGQFCFAMRLQGHRITTTKKATQKKQAKNELVKVFLQWLRIID